MVLIPANRWRVRNWLLTFVRASLIVMSAFLVASCGDGDVASVWFTSTSSDIHHVVLRGAGPGDLSSGQFQVDVPAGDWRSEITITSGNKGEILVYDQGCKELADFTIGSRDFHVSIESSGQPSIAGGRGSSDAPLLNRTQITCGLWTPTVHSEEPSVSPSRSPSPRPS